MTAPTFTLTRYDTVGRDEREREIEVTYTVDRDGEVKLIDARNVTFGGYIENDYTLAWLEDECREEAPEAYAEWLADYGEYLRDAAEDRRAA